MLKVGISLCLLHSTTTYCFYEAGAGLCKKWIIFKLVCGKADTIVMESTRLKKWNVKTLRRFSSHIPFRVSVSSSETSVDFVICSFSLLPVLTFCRFIFLKKDTLRKAVWFKVHLVCYLLKDRSDFLEYFKPPKTLAQTIIFFSKSPRLGSVLGLSWTPTCCERTEWSSEVFTGYLGCPYLLPYFWLLTGREYIAPQIQKGMEWCAWWRWLHHSGCSRLFSKAYPDTQTQLGFLFFPWTINFAMAHTQSLVFSIKRLCLLLKKLVQLILDFHCKLAAPFPVMNEYGAVGKTEGKQNRRALLYSNWKRRNEGPLSHGPGIWHTGA